jgi:CheY-like chemotaxis protein
MATRPRPASAASRSTAQLPLIAMTAHAVAGFRESSLGMGMNDYVTKPIDPERLFAVLAGQISRAAMRPPRRSMAAIVGAQQATPLPGIDMPEVLARLGGNRQLLTALLDRFRLDFDTAPQRLLAAIDDGAYDQAALLVQGARRGRQPVDAGTAPRRRRTGTAAAVAAPPPCTDELAAFSTALERVLDGLQAQDGLATALPLAKKCLCRSMPAAARTRCRSTIQTKG